MCEGGQVCVYGCVCVCVWYEHKVRAGKSVCGVGLVCSEKYIVKTKTT